MSQQFPPPDPDSGWAGPTGQPTPAGPPLPSGSPLPPAPPVAGPPLAVPAAQPWSGAETVQDGASVLPPQDAAPARGRGGRTAIIATVVVLALLLGAGAAYGWNVLHRADVTLARAYDATTSQASGSMTISVEPGTSASARSLAGSALRYAWGPGTQQVQVTVQGTPFVDLVTTAKHATLQVDWSALPDSASAADQLHQAAASLPALADPLNALADGKPVGIAIGPGSPLQSILDQAQQATGSKAPTQISPAQISAIGDSLSKAIKDNITVTRVGSDQYGDHDRITLPLKPVVQSVLGSITAALPPGLGAMAAPDLSSLDGRTLTADVWSNDGQLSRVEVPVDQFQDGGAKDGSKILITFSSAGVQAPSGPVTEISGDAIKSALGDLGGLGALGGLGGLGSLGN